MKAVLQMWWSRILWTRLRIGRLSALMDQTLNRRGLMRTGQVGTTLAKSRLWTLLMMEVGTCIIPMTILRTLVSGVPNGIGVVFRFISGMSGTSSSNKALGQASASSSWGDQTLQSSLPPQGLLSALTSGQSGILRRRYHHPWPTVHFLELWWWAQFHKALRCVCVCQLLVRTRVEKCSKV